MSYSSSDSSYYYDDSSECYEDNYETNEIGVYVIDSSAKSKIQPYATLVFQPHEAISYRNLLIKLCQHFPVLKNQTVHLTCIDEYEDFQTISNDEDLEIAMEQFQNERNLYVIYNDEIQISTEDSFPCQYFCNFCCFALRHFRYKCTVCPDYDICARCQNNGIHNSHELEYVDIVSSDESFLEIDEIDYNRLWRKTCIGEGSFGKVFKALNTNTNEMVAVKFFKDSGLENSFGRELAVMEQMGEHENVVKILGYCGPRVSLGLVMECVTMEVNGKEISGLIMYLMYLRKLFQRKIPIDNRELDSFAMQIARGMEHLENHNIVHRDLAARNILIDSNKNLKISDFGLSRIGDYYQGKYSIFAMRWAAPEIIKYETYSNKSDVWAFGVVLWEIATLGGLPYNWLDSDGVSEFVRKSGHLNKPRSVSDRLFDIMTRCWTVRPENRPNFSDLVVKFLDFKWMDSAYRDFDDLYDDFELPYAWEVYERKLQWL